MGSESSIKSEVIEGLLKYKSVLLEGPPGTGKTHLVREILEDLQKLKFSSNGKGTEPTVNISDVKRPFKPRTTSEEGSLHWRWTTFHESYSYEDFILGLRPLPDQGGTRLAPFAGALLDLAVTIDPGLGEGGVGLLIVDEINRANTARVFGEFITFMDVSYRRSSNGRPNPLVIAPRFSGLRFETSGESEAIRLVGGRSISLPAGWTIPENLLILATMNSVDKGALPLDAAFLRRFRRFFLAPDEEALRSYLNSRTTSEASEAIQMTLSLFRRINKFLIEVLGQDFQLGHTVFFSVADGSSNCRDSLVRTWNNSVLPQLLDRLSFNRSLVNNLLGEPWADSSDSTPPSWSLRDESELTRLGPTIGD